MTQNVNAVVKSYSAFAVNEGLLARIVEAVKQGDRDARRTGQIRSFEVFYHGHRHDLVMGRIMVIPAKVADSIEEFPSALLYGAMVKEMSGETVSDVYNYKLGEGEFDEYSPKDMLAIKDKLFKDVDGKYRTIVLFIPTWASPRDYVLFKFTKDDVHLAMLLRHMVFAAYFDPALSSAFNEMSTSVQTEKMDVTDITPKLNYPFLAENLLKQYPDLEPGDKTASARRPKMILAKGTLEAVQEEFLEPGEQAVMNQLFEDLKDKVEGESVTPEEAAKQAGRGAEQQTYQGWRSAVKKICPTATFEGDKDICSAFDKEGGKDIGEWDGAVGKIYSKEAAIHAIVAKGGSLKAAGNREWGMYKDEDGVHWSVFGKGMGMSKLLGSGIAPSNEAAQAEIDKLLNDPKALPPQPFNNRITTTAGSQRDHGKAEPVEVLKEAGSKMLRKGASLTAIAPSGYREVLRVQGRSIRWVQPNQFNRAFRASAENFIRNPRTAATLKKADVPMTFSEIWGERTEEMGPAPQVELKTTPRAEPSHQPEQTSDAEGSKEEGESKEWSFDAKGSKEAAIQKCQYCGKPAEGHLCKKCEDSLFCEVCGKNLGKTSWNEIAPDRFAHDTCATKRKEAAFNLFIPGQVTREFYPELLQESIDYPAQDYSAPISDVGGPGADGAYVPTSPAGGIGIGTDGKPQVLDGAPLRSEQDIRGYMFDQEFYSQYEGIDSSGMVTASVLANIRKQADAAELKHAFTDFLKKVMGEIAASFMAAFKVTQRPLLNAVPGTREIQLQLVEEPMMGVIPYSAGTPSGRVQFMLSKLNDSDIQDAINAAYCQASVWNEDPDGGFVYEVFVRPESIDQDTMVLKYSFVIGTKGI